MAKVECSKQGGCVNDDLVRYDKDFGGDGQDSRNLGNSSDDHDSRGSESNRDHATSHADGDGEANPIFDSVDPGTETPLAVAKSDSKSENKNDVKSSVDNDYMDMETVSNRTDSPQPNPLRDVVGSSRTHVELSNNLKHLSESESKNETTPQLPTTVTGDINPTEVKTGKTSSFTKSNTQDTICLTSVTLPQASLNADAAYSTELLKDCSSDISQIVSDNDIHATDKPANLNNCDPSATVANDYHATQEPPIADNFDFLATEINVLKAEHDTKKRSDSSCSSDKEKCTPSISDANESGDLEEINATSNTNTDTDICVNIETFCDANTSKSLSPKAEAKPDKIGLYSTSPEIKNEEDFTHNAPTDSFTDTERLAHTDTSLENSTVERSNSTDDQKPTLVDTVTNEDSVVPLTTNIGPSDDSVVPLTTNIEPSDDSVASLSQKQTSKPFDIDGKSQDEEGKADNTLNSFSAKKETLLDTCVSENTPKDIVDQVLTSNTDSKSSLSPTPTEDVVDRTIVSEHTPKDIVDQVLTSNTDSKSSLSPTPTEKIVDVHLTKSDQRADLAKWAAASIENFPKSNQNSSEGSADAISAITSDVSVTISTSQDGVAADSTKADTAMSRSSPTTTQNSSKFSESLRDMLQSSKNKSHESSPSITASSRVKDGPKEEPILIVGDDEEEESNVDRDDDDEDATHTVKFPSPSAGGSVVPQKRRKDDHDGDGGGDVVMFKPPNKQTKYCSGDGTRCAQCGKAFKDQFQFSIHIGIHFINMKGYDSLGQCALCGIMFTDLRYMTSHLKSAKERMSRAMGLVEHKRVLESDRPVQTSSFAEPSPGSKRQRRAPDVYRPPDIKRPNILRGGRSNTQVEDKPAKHPGDDPLVKSYLRSLLDEGLPVDPSAFFIGREVRRGGGMYGMSEPSVGGIGLDHPRFHPRFVPIQPRSQPQTVLQGQGGGYRPGNYPAAQSQRVYAPGQGQDSQKKASYQELLRHQQTSAAPSAPKQMTRFVLRTMMPDSSQVRDARIQALRRQKAGRGRTRGMSREVRVRLRRLASPPPSDNGVWRAKPAGPPMASSRPVQANNTRNVSTFLQNSFHPSALLNKTVHFPTMRQILQPNHQTEAATSLRLLNNLKQSPYVNYSQQQVSTPKMAGPASSSHFGPRAQYRGGSNNAQPFTLRDASAGFSGSTPKHMSSPRNQTLADAQTVSLDDYLDSNPSAKVSYYMRILSNQPFVRLRRLDLSRIRRRESTYCAMSAMRVAAHSDAMLWDHKRPTDNQHRSPADHQHQQRRLNLKQGPQDDTLSSLFHPGVRYVSPSQQMPKPLSITTAYQHFKRKYEYPNTSAVAINNQNRNFRQSNAAAINNNLNNRRQDTLNTVKGSPGVKGPYALWAQHVRRGPGINNNAARSGNIPSSSRPGFARHGPASGGLRLPKMTSPSPITGPSSSASSSTNVVILIDDDDDDDDEGDKKITIGSRTSSCIGASKQDDRKSVTLSLSSPNGGKMRASLQGPSGFIGEMNSTTSSEGSVLRDVNPVDLDNDVIPDSGSDSLSGQRLEEGKTESDKISNSTSTNLKQNVDMESAKIASSTTSISENAASLNKTSDDVKSLGEELEEVGEECCEKEGEEETGDDICGWTVSVAKHSDGSDSEEDGHDDEKHEEDSSANGNTSPNVCAVSISSHNENSGVIVSRPSEKTDNSNIMENKCVNDVESGIEGIYCKNSAKGVVDTSADGSDQVDKTGVDQSTVKVGEENGACESEETVNPGEEIGSAADIFSEIEKTCREMEENSQVSESAKM